MTFDISDSDSSIDFWNCNLNDKLYLKAYRETASDLPFPEDFLGHVVKKSTQGTSEVSYMVVFKSSSSNTSLFPFAIMDRS